MQSWQITVAAVFFIVALLPISFCFRAVARNVAGLVVAGVVILSLAAITLASLAFPMAPREELARQAGLPRENVDREFVSSSSCRACHPEQYSSWHATFHRTMTQLATPNSVLAPFDDVQLELDGSRYRLWREGDEFWAEMPDADEESYEMSQGRDVRTAKVATVRRQVVLTTGSHRVQHYWVASSRGYGLLNLPWEFHIADQRWIPMMDAHVIPPDQPRTVSHWNSQCIICHSVNGLPGVDPTSGQWRTQVTELGISCEACHGPGAEHVAHHRNPLNRYRQRRRHDADPTIVNPARVDSKASAQICGQCHSTFHMTNENGIPDFSGYLMHGNAYRAGGDLAKSRRMLSTQKPGAQKNGGHFRNLYSNENDARNAFWRDGAPRVGGREYLGLLDSPCFLNGEMSCLSCHSMHRSDPDGQVAELMDTNQACLQCHVSVADKVAAHTHHAEGSSGSLCYNCHMPHTSFALLRAARSHRIDSPSAASSARTGRPNACNLCHLDQTLAWSARHLTDWYDSPEPELDQQQQEVAASVLWLLKGDAAQRAVTAWHAGWEPAQKASGEVGWQVPFLAPLLEDPYSVVRHVAVRALKSLPQLDDLDVDYIGSEQHRSQAKLELLGDWQQHGSELITQPNSRLLLDAGPVVQQEKIQQLLLQRDDSPVQILE